MKMLRKIVYWSVCLQLLSLGCSVHGQNRPLERAVEQNELLRENGERNEVEERFRLKEQEEAIKAADPTSLGVDIKAIRLVLHQDRVDQSPAIKGDLIQVDHHVLFAKYVPKAPFG